MDRNTCASGGNINNVDVTRIDSVIRWGIGRMGGKCMHSRSIDGMNGHSVDGKNVRHVDSRIMSVVSRMNTGRLG